ncbi:MAG TPA: serine hydrolase domain-containing protein [Cyclobacteriaceae bacterium]|nr:serine hydrolase domain-containing protein [Cyclobacteriaceae bacterium]
MTKPLTLFVNLLIVFSACQPKKETTSSKSTADKIDSLMQAISDFSGVILFAESGDIKYLKPFGVRNFETNVPIQPTDIFELASVSKQFTAMAIMMLKEEGKLNYDDPIEKFLPGLPYQNITIRHLLTHTSGLPDYQAVMDEYWDKSKVANNKDILEYLIKYQPPINFNPGEKYEYSNTGYVFLASIAEAASGQDFVTFCADRIFGPVQMTSTAIRSNEEKLGLSNLAHGHIFVPEKNRFVRADSFPSSNYTIWLGGRKGPGRVSSTAEDLLKWDQALYSDQLVSQETLAEAFTPQTLNNGTKSNYGFGWTIIPDSPSGKVVWHNGDNPGYKTIIVRYIAQQKTLIMLCNNYHSQFEEIRKAVDKMLKVESEEVQ